MLEDQRDGVPATSGRIVRATVPLDVDTHVRLAAVAALRGVDKGALASQLIREGLKGLITIIDKSKPKKSPLRKPADAVDLPDEGIGEVEAA